VGDSFYERESDTTRNAPWGPEPPMPTIFAVESDLFDWWASMKKVLAFVREKNLEAEDKAEGEAEGDTPTPISTSLPAHAPTAQTGFGTPTPSSTAAQPVADEDWTLISLPLATRTRLAAAHVSVSVDAETAVLQMLAFMRRVLRDKVAKRRIPDRGGRGIESWLWDDCPAEEEDGEAYGDGGRKGHARFSVQAPLCVVEEGRRRIPREEWA